MRVMMATVVPTAMGAARGSIVMPAAVAASQRSMPCFAFAQTSSPTPSATPERSWW